MPPRAKKAPVAAFSDDDSLGGSPSASDDDGMFDFTAAPKEVQAPPLKAGKDKTIEQRFQKKTQLEHILLRPDTYVGSLQVESTMAWVWDDERERMTYRQLSYIPAMYKIFDEILVNAADVKAREMHEGASKGARMTRIDVDIDEANATISVTNDGAGIPVEIHREHKVYVPELIFGHLLTSDNYDDTDQRVTGGRNGYGAKLTNIFSEKFTVEVTDSSRRRKFAMTWSNNMSSHTDAKITDCSAKGDSVKIAFRPDLQRFKCERLDPDLIALMKKRVHDIAGTTGVKVSLNSKRIPVKDFKSYVDLYFPKPVADENSHTSNSPTAGESTSGQGDDGLSDFIAEDDDDEYTEGSKAGKKSKKAGSKGADSKAASTEMTSTGIVKIHERVNDRWEIVVSQSEGQFQQVSFVNSICTTKGGTHVQYVVEPLIAAILKKVATKNKGGMEIKGHHVRNHLFVFVNCLIVNPTFDSQTKETMTLKPSYFGSTCQVSEKTINAVVKSPITETVLLWAQTKQEVDLKRKMKVSGGGRRDRILGVPKLEDANDAGTRMSQHCTLILTEGDSAKTSCLAGLSVVGRDRYGVFPLRGKLLNVRDASFKALTENKEIQNILTITGLQAGQKDIDPRQLRYGSIMIMTDQDADGSHIKGLLINFLQHFWPDLLRARGFLKEFVTPIVKVSRRKGEEIAFYTLPEYEHWKRLHQNGKGWKVKYYKGLGTSDDKEFKQYFSQLDKHQLEFDYEDEADFELIDMAFNSKRAEDRKAWIQSFQEGTYLDHREKVIKYKDFVNKELVLFSKYDTERSIPNLVDGWKPGQRKALFGVLKKNLVKSEMKVAQLAAYISDVSCYHHGETSMEGTIVNMAQNFVGSNNLNILQPCGQFGSRKEGGKDASASRYIYTRLTMVARHIFVAADEELLTYNNEEGRVVEPKWYIPVIPLILVNGGEGIGTGWSCSVPNYNPRDLISNLRRFIAGEPMEAMTPWYRGFRGRIEPQAKKENGYESIGIIEKTSEDTLVISELPVKQWTQPYKDFLDEWLAWSMAEEEAAENRAQGRSAPKRAVVPKAKVKAGAKAKAKAGSGGPVAVRAFKFLIQDYRDNSSHEHIHFTVKMHPDQLAMAEQEGLEKVFRLKKSLPTTNMTLFTHDGLVQKFENELDIMKAFSRVRLDYYHRRKRHLLNLLEKECCLVGNKLKFVTAVIENDLIVHKRKRAELVADLKSRGFHTMKEINDKFNTTNPTMQGELDEDGIVREVDEEEVAAAEDPEETTARDYDYLVGMSLWNLTAEKVTELRKQLQNKEQELEMFKRLTPEDLWRQDLDKLESAIDDFEMQLAKEQAKDEALQNKAGNITHNMTSGPQKRGRAKAATTKTSAATKKVKAEPVSAKTSEPVTKKVPEPAKPPQASTSSLFGAIPTPTSPPRDFSLMERLRAKLAAEKEVKPSVFDTLLGKEVTSQSGSLAEKIGTTTSSSTAGGRLKRGAPKTAEPAKKLARGAMGEFTSSSGSQSPSDDFTDSDNQGLLGAVKKPTTAAQGPKKARVAPKKKSAMVVSDSEDEEEEEAMDEEESEEDEAFELGDSESE